MESLEYVVDFGTWAESLMKDRPTKQIEDKLGKIQEAMKALLDNYKLANAPAIRTEHEHRRDLMRQQRQARSNNGEPPATPPQ